MGHPEREIPFCLKRYRILTESSRVLFEAAENHQTRNVIVLPGPVTATAIHMEILETRGMPAAVFEMRCYED